jgi:hypothetical protein
MRSTAKSSPAARCPQHRRFTDAQIATAPLDKKRKELWEALNDFVCQNGGWIVSPPHSSQIRFECSPGSALPKSLRELGHVPRKGGTVERLMPVAAGDQVGTVRVEIYEIDLPICR